jgi:exodeoxyribonuclease-3
MTLMKNVPDFRSECKSRKERSIFCAIFVIPSLDFGYNCPMLTLYSWNVNGIRALQKKGFLEWLDQTRPDILCIQETKADPHQLETEIVTPAGYFSYWASAERKGYSGVALFSRVKPSSVQIGMGIEEYDREGRTIIADYDDFVLINAYFPNGSRDHSRVPFKMAYKASFLQYCNQLREAGRKVIFCGDVNTAHREIDLARPKENEKTTGFLPIERAWIDKAVEQGYIDTFRHLCPDEEGAYSWWAYWGSARERNIGWRIDYFFITPDLVDQVSAAKIHADVHGSDHCPISLTLS